MRKLFLLMSLTLFIGCQDAGTTSETLTGYEQNLPKELKGLKVYRIADGKGGAVKVAVLDNKINSTTYQQGKLTESVIILDKRSKKLIEVENITVINDTLILCEKPTYLE